jgi:hypothetical protein
VRTAVHTLVMSYALGDPTHVGANLLRGMHCLTGNRVKGVLDPGRPLARLAIVRLLSNRVAVVALLQRRPDFGPTGETSPRVSTNWDIPTTSARYHQRRRHPGDRVMNLAALYGLRSL